MREKIFTNYNLVSLPFKWMMFLGLLFGNFQMIAQVTCNGLVNISLDGDCQTMVTADQILEGTYQNYEDYEVTFTNTGAPAILGANHVGGTYSITVTGPTGLHCEGNVLVEDKVDPIIICGDLHLACTDQIPTDAYEAYDGCGSVTVTHEDVIVQEESCNGPYSTIITRTYTATDASGNSATCVQNIYFERSTLDNIEFPPSIEIGCQDSSNPNDTGFPTGADCFNLDFTYEDTEVLICAGSRKILREWTAIDWCATSGNNILKRIQIIKLLDTTGPQIEELADITVGTSSNSCTANVNLPSIGLSDDCSGSSFDVYIETPLGIINGNGGLLVGAPLGNHEITYFATDACGNESYYSFTLTIVDNIAPIPICDFHTKVAIGSDGMALVDALTFDDGSTDNCGIVLYEVRRMSQDICDLADDGNSSNNSDATNFSSSVPFYCCDIGETVMVELRIKDEAGNTNSCMVEVEVEDKISPTLVCPPNKELYCDEDYTDFELTGQATATDNCSNIPVTYQDIEDLGCGGVGSVTRIWTATDESGNTTSCVQTITLINDEPFYINRDYPLDPSDDIVWPIDYETNSCGVGLEPENLPTPYNRPVVSEDACDFIAVSKVDTYLPIQEPACVKVLRKWIVIDWCQAEDNQDPTQPGPGVWHYTQVIKIINSTDPVIDNISGSTMIDNFEAECGATAAEFTITASDDCTDESDLEYIWEFSTGLSGTGKTATGNFEDGSYSLTFTVADGCGNTTSETKNFTVKDAKKPTPVCILGLATVIMPSSGTVTIWATDFESGSSYDNCTDYEDLKFSFSSDVTDTHLDISCADVNSNGIYPVEIWATDLAGNQDFCSTLISIQDPNGACAFPTAVIISGNVENENQEKLEDVTVNIDGGAMTPIVTNSTGSFAFPQVSMGGSYTITPQKDINYLNGVTTYDLVLISKHILGIELLDSPYKIIAADANHSQTITTLDIVKLRALILHIDETLTNNNSWRFVDASYQFPDSTNPFVTAFPEATSFNDLTASQQTNFIGVKIGDVNGTAATNNLMAVDTRNFEGTLGIDLEDQKIIKGETFKVDFKAKDFNVMGYQFALEFDKMNFVDVTPNLEKLTTDNFGFTLLQEGVITTSWSNSKAVKIDNDKILFSLTFQATDDLQLSEVLRLSTRYTTAEAYDSSSKLFDVALHINGSTVNASAFALYQNTPNPFKGETKIGFNLPEAGGATLKVYDAAGRILKLVEGDFAKGYNEIKINRNELEGVGILYYQLDSNNNTATKKMILVE